MYQETEDLFDKKQTAATIKKLVATYYKDLEDISINVSGKSIPVLSLSLFEFFDFVRKIPYRRDPSPLEIVSRPYYILKHLKIGMDCKKKAILISAYLKNKGVQYRYIASSKRPDKKIHHIFVQGLIDNEWKNLDATYSNYKPFESKTVTKAEIL
jgi:hypothetical protein